MKWRAVIALMPLMCRLANSAPAGDIILTPTAEVESVLWHYTFKMPPAGWTQPEFNDRAWETGPGGFGAENTPGARVGTVWLEREIWLRRSFVITNLDSSALALRIHHDDDAEVYLNGVLAARRRGFTQAYRDLPINDTALRALRAGTNVIALHCRQFRLGQFIDAGLVARRPQELASLAVRSFESETLPWQGTALSPAADVPGVLWKYRTAAPPGNWTELVYDDSNWEEGESGFGTSAPGAISRTQWNTQDLWLRRRFTVTNLNASFQLVMHHDDDAQVYLNGVLACNARNFTAGYCEFAMSDAAVKALKLGTNLLAVHCRQSTAGQYVDAALFVRDRPVAKLTRQPPSEITVTQSMEWPNFLGPTHNAVYHGPPLLDKWPTEGPRRVWRKTIGDGWSSPVVGEGRLIVCHRQEDDLVVDCLDPQTGASHWSFREEMAFPDRGRSANGPRATPAIRDGRVFIHNRTGTLICLKLADGTLLWSHALRLGAGRDATPSGSVSSPLVTEKAVILHVGQPQRSVVAYAVATGEELWTAFSDLASMSSPVPTVLDGKPQVLLVTRSTLRSFHPETGALNWQYAPHQQGSATLFAATPVVSGNDVLLTGWHGLAARVVRVSGGSLERLWVRNDALSSEFATPIVIDGYAYGFHGIAGNLRLRCMALETGEVKQDMSIASPGTMIRCGKNVLVQSEVGEIYLMRPSPDFISFPATARPLSRSSHSYPAIVNGYVYARDHRQIICLDLRAAK